MRAPLFFLAAALAAGCTATASGTVAPGASASPKASQAPASAAPGASTSPAVSASASASGGFEAVKSFESTAFTAKLDGKDAPMSTLVDRVVLQGVPDTVALTLGKVLGAVPVGQHQVVFSIAGNAGKHAAMPTFTTADVKSVGWQFFEGNGKYTPKGYLKSGDAGTETITFAGGKLNATIKTEVKATVDFTNTEPKRMLELTIVDLPM